MNERPMHVTQTIGAPTSEQELKAPRKRKAIRRYILQRWMECKRDNTIVIVYSSWDYADWLKASKLPDNISIVHYDKVWGTDRLMDLVNRVTAEPNVGLLLIV
jgi:hypothetical protein